MKSLGSLPAWPEKKNDLLWISKITIICYLFGWINWNRRAFTFQYKENVMYLLNEASSEVFLTADQMLLKSWTKTWTQDSIAVDAYYNFGCCIGTIGPRIRPQIDENQSRASAPLFGNLVINSRTIRKTKGLERAVSESPGVCKWAEKRSVDRAAEKAAGWVSWNVLPKASPRDLIGFKYVNFTWFE